MADVHRPDSHGDLPAATIELVESVRQLPFVWPSPPTASSARTLRQGTCASKHALLREELARLGVDALPLLAVGPLVPDVLAEDPVFAGGTDLLEVHECLTVLTPWAGAVRVDVTYDDPLLDRGLPGTRRWDGRSDMLLAVGEGSPGWAVPADDVRPYKEQLRSRLYTEDQRHRREEVLAQLSDVYRGWRNET